jgi:ATP/maltotriose-dependent transcriptional regulator MalT
MEQGTVTTQPLGQSFIIKRPRLTKLLDESGARIILLVAPAGYGKTTLAREWVAEREGVVWYSGRPAMADVAALASGLAATLAVDDDSAAAATARLRILASRGQPPEVLAKAVAAGVTAACSTLVIDDCHYAAGSPHSEMFLGELIEHTTFRVLLASRVRPEWIRPRMVVYGDVAALEMSDLAFTDDEARAVIHEAPDDAEDGLLVRARGWPAVIGLAAQRRGTNPRATLPADDLYGYFAEDLFQQAPPELQSALILLALGGDTDVDCCRALCAPDHERILTMATEQGFISAQPRELRIHPLLRGFLLTKLHELPPNQAGRLVRLVVDVLAARRLWDECLAALECAPLDDLVASVLNSALADLLDSGRIATVRQWLALARTSQVGDPILLLAEAEIALRDQDDAKAQVLGERAGELLSKGDAAARAYIVAARAAHLRDDRSGVARNSELAQSAAATVDLQTTALWIAFANAVEWSAPEAKAILNRLRDLRDARPDHALRVLNAEGWLLMDAESDLRAAAEKFELAKALVPHARDPFLTTNLLNVFAHILLLLAEYDRALALVDELVAEAQANGLEFAVDHALVTKAGSLIGRRKISAAERTLKEIDERSANATAHILESTHLQHVRLLIAAGDLERASSLLQREPLSSFGRAHRMTTALED